MQTIRFQNLTPETYPAESRDFQLLCRLYDSIYNGVKYDTDSIIYLLDTWKIQSNMLPLLQTKLGFFSNKKFDDNQLRYILSVFPDLVRNKGSLNAIKKLLNMCLKLNNIPGSFTVSVADSATVINGVLIDAHTIIVGIDTILKSTEILNELAKYILPAGFGFYIYFYKNLNTLDKIYINDDVKLLFSSSNIMAQIRGSYKLYDDELENNLLGAVDTVWLNSIDSKPSTNFLGIFDTVSALPVSSTKGHIAIADHEMYYYENGWHKLDFIGNYNELTLANIPNPQNYDVAGILNNNKYYIYVGDSYIDSNYRGVYESTDDVPNVEENDLINLMESVTTYKLYRDGQWNDVAYRGTFSSSDQVYQEYKSTVAPVIDLRDFRQYILGFFVTLQNKLALTLVETLSYNLVILNGANYYMYNNNVWNNYSDTLYMLKQYYVTNNSDGD